MNKDGQTINLDSIGDVYKNEKTENAGIFDSIILGEMADSGNVNFNQLKLDKEKLSLNIILQIIDTKELLRFEWPIDSSLFDSIYNSHTNDLNGEELEKKIVELYSVSSNLVDKQDSVDEAEMVIKEASTSDKISIAARGTMSGWKTLINDLNRYGSVKLSNYSNINSYMFKGGGWHYDSSWVTTPYQFTAYSMVNDSYEYLTQFSLVDISTNSQYIASGTYDTAIQANYYDGLMVKYDYWSDTLSVFYYGFGLDHSNYKVGINKLNNNAVFVSRNVNIKCTVKDRNYVRAAISLSATASTIYDVFDNMTDHKSQNTNSTEYFDGNYWTQYNRNNGKVVRGIMSDTKSDYLSKSGHYVNVAGRFVYNTSLGANWSYGYSYNSRAYM